MTFQTKTAWKIILLVSSGEKYNEIPGVYIFPEIKFTKYPNVTTRTVYMFIIYEIPIDLILFTLDRTESKLFLNNNLLWKF